MPNNTYNVIISERNSLIQQRNEQLSPVLHISQVKNEPQKIKPRIGRAKYIISKIVRFKRKFNLTPEQNNYIDKRVRAILGLKRARKVKRLPDYLKPQEIYRFLEVARRMSNVKLLLGKILIFSGLRINEMRLLDIRDIDFYNNELKVVNGKGGKDRIVPIPPFLLDHIKQYVHGRNKGTVFQYNGRPFHVRTLQKYIEQILKVCAFPKKLSTHSLRHTFACLCLAKGMKLEEIKVIMGHSSILTTEIYARLELGSIKEKYLQIMGII